MSEMEMTGHFAAFWCVCTLMRKSRKQMGRGAGRHKRAARSTHRRTWPRTSQARGDKNLTRCTPTHSSSDPLVSAATSAIHKPDACCDRATPASSGKRWPHLMPSSAGRLLGETQAAHVVHDQRPRRAELGRDRFKWQSRRLWHEQRIENDGCDERTCTRGERKCIEDPENKST